MKKLAGLLFLVSVVFIQGCKVECDECFTPPEPFRFELTDGATGENLFTNGTFDRYQIEVINTSDSSSVEFDFIDENDINIIMINSIGWRSEKVNIAVIVSDATIFHLYVDAERKSEDCCSFTRYNEIRIDEAVYEINPATGIYKILLYFMIFHTDGPATS